MKWCCLLALFLIGSAVWGQTSATFRNRLAWRLENDKLRVTVLPGGGHIGVQAYARRYFYSLIIDFFDPQLGAAGQIQHRDTKERKKE